MKPALTVEEWRYPRLYFRGNYDAVHDKTKSTRGEPREGPVGGRDYTYGVELVVTPSTRDDPPLWVWDDSWAVMVPKAIRHGLAALSLKDQAFGFTWEDVDDLRGYNYLYGATPPDLYYRAFESLAERIAALLSPRNP